jgi:two-component system osmolarity sensor histidine kinase EnvZ
VRELQSVLLRASGEVREAATERQLMLAGISHDLRTPLTRVQFALEMLPGTDPALRAGMERDIGEIDAILSQFIAYARDGRDEAVEAVDLAAICRNALAATEFDWEADLPAQAPMRGRPMALLRAVENLLGNAERHGEPTFALSLRRDGDAWRIEVADQGAGISVEAAKRVRQPFVHDGSAGGTGLGLAIVDRIARQHHGELQLLANAPRGLRAVLLLRDA